MNDYHDKPGLNGDKNSLVEQSLKEILCHSLNINSIASTDNFFELGCDSLLSLVIIDQIKQHLGWEISLGDFLRYPTIAGLMDNMYQAKAARTDRALIRMSVRGQQRACVFIHPVGGLTFSYLKLMRNIGNNRSYYGIQSCALAGLIVPLTMENMAEVYSDIIYDELGNDEFNIIGWSMGGVIGFEMARIAADKDLNLHKLILIDSYLTDKVSHKLSEEDLLNEFYLDILSQVPIQDAILNNRKFDNSGEVLHEVGKILFSDHFNQDNAGIELVKRLYEVYKANVYALSSYQATSANVSCLLISDVENDTVNDWKRVVQGKFRNEVIECGHYGLLDQQHSLSIATRIKKYIE